MTLKDEEADKKKPGGEDAGLFGIKEILFHLQNDKCFHFFFHYFKSNGSWWKKNEGDLKTFGEVIDFCNRKIIF